MNSTIPERYEPRAERSITLSSLPIASWGEAADCKSQCFCMIHAPASLVGLKLIDQHTTKGRCDTCEARAVVCRPYVPKAEAKSPEPERPLWQMDLRHKLGIPPGRNDVYAIVLSSAIYGSDSSVEAAERMQEHVENFQRAIRIIREEM